MQATTTLATQVTNAITAAVVSTATGTAPAYTTAELIHDVKPLSENDSVRCAQRLEPDSERQEACVALFGAQACRLTGWESCPHLRRS